MMDCEPPFSQSLLVEIRRQYRLDWNGLHGASHWARVLENGLHLCAATPGLRRDVVLLFDCYKTPAAMTTATMASAERSPAGTAPHLPREVEWGDAPPACPG